MSYALEINVHYEDLRWTELRDDLAQHFQKILNTTLEPFLKEAASVHQELAITLNNVEQMRGINNEHRGKDKPTNVLSFPHYESLQDILETTHPVTLGDIVLCLDVIEAEAKEQNKPLDHHIAHMLVHGALHLIGFDHEVSEVEAEKMEAYEEAILEQFNIPSPY